MDAIKTGRFIAEKRKKLNMSQRELAECLRITDKDDIFCKFYWFYGKSYCIIIITR